MDIPLEYFREGIDWLRKNAPSPPDRVAVMGASRGGELALLLGSTFLDDVAAVVAKVPSGVVWGGLTRDRVGHLAAWTVGGRPVQWLEGRHTAPDDLPQREGDMELTPAFNLLLAEASPQARAEAEIPVERSGGPVLLISGEDDAMWPSVTLSEIAVERAEAHGGRHPLRHLRYPDAGHAFTVPAGLPVARASQHPVDGGTRLRRLADRQCPGQRRRLVGDSQLSPGNHWGRCRQRGQVTAHLGAGYRTVGRSGLVVSELGIGASTFGRSGMIVTSQRAVDDIVAHALDLGITDFEIADVYGDTPGLSEALLGNALGYAVTTSSGTKFGGALHGLAGQDWGVRGSRRYVRRAVEGSLARLKTDWIDLYQIHMPDPFTPIEETL